MRFFMITAVFASVAVAIAMPAMDAYAQETPRLCSSGTASNPVCCALSVLGAADLDCAPREFFLPACANRRKSLIHIALLTASRLPKDIPDFKGICAESGQRARCCLLVIVRNPFILHWWTRVFIRDATWIGWSRCPLLCSHLNLEILPQELEGIDSWNYLKKREKIGDKKRVIESFEKATENGR